MIAPVAPLLDTLIIGLAAPAGGGKSTAAAYLCAAHKFEACAFADGIANMAEALVLTAGGDYAHLHERSLKEQPIPELAAPGRPGPSARQLKQTLGDWGREIDADFWVDLTARTLGLHDLPHSAPVHDRIVITDVRYPNEAEWIQSLGGHILRLHRNTTPVRMYSSEQHLDNLPIWHHIDNAGNEEYLYGQLDAAVQRLVDQRSSYAHGKHNVSYRNNRRQAFHHTDAGAPRRPDGDRLSIALRALCVTELSTQEVAAILGITTNEARSKVLQRAAGNWLISSLPRDRWCITRAGRTHLRDVYGVDLQSIAASATATATASTAPAANDEALPQITPPNYLLTSGRHARRWEQATPGRR